MTNNIIDKHPVQTPLSSGQGKAPVSITMRAYEVYCHVYSPQKALVTDGCRGGFAVSELVAFLYARSFPKDEWKKRVREASSGLENI